LPQIFHLDQLLELLQQGNIKALSRIISLIESEVGDYHNLLTKLQVSTTKVIGITGPPGVGKSTLVDALINELVISGKKVGILCVDPSSPFNHGALLGDRIRMSEWNNSSFVFIRSLASKGSSGGLHPKIIEITDVMKAAQFDHIIVETVGVGQSEIEVAGLADTTVVVLMPDGGDEIQTMKAGLMEIADIFVVNKADRPEADLMARNLHNLLAPTFNKKKFPPPIVKTIATQKKGITELLQNITKHEQYISESEKKYWLLSEKAYYLIQSHRMKDVNRNDLLKEIRDNYENFNLYQFVNSYKNR